MLLCTNSHLSEENETRREVIWGQKETEEENDRKIEKRRKGEGGRRWREIN